MLYRLLLLTSLTLPAYLLAATPAPSQREVTLSRGPVWWVDESSGKVIRSAPQRPASGKWHRNSRRAAALRKAAARAARAIPAVIRTAFTLQNVAAKPPSATPAAGPLVVHARISDGTVVTTLAQPPPVRPGVVVISNLDGGTREFALGS